MKIFCAAMLILAGGFISAADFQVKTESSEISFYVPAKITNVRGYFREFSLRNFHYDVKKGISASSGDLVIKTASVFTRDRKRDAHLRENDFFYSEKFPEAVVRITRIKLIAADNYEAETMIQIRDKVFTYQIPVKIQIVDAQTVRASGSVTLNRKNFDLTGNHIANIIMKDEVEVSFRLLIAR